MRTSHLTLVCITLAFLTGCSPEPPPPTNATHLAPFYEDRYNSYVALPSDVPATYVVMDGLGASVVADESEFTGYDLIFVPKIRDVDDPDSQIWFCVKFEGDEEGCTVETEIPEGCETAEIPASSGECTLYSELHPLEIKQGDLDLKLVAGVRFKDVDQTVQDFVLSQPLTFDWENRPWTKRVWERVTEASELRYPN